MKKYAKNVSRRKIGFLRWKWNYGYNQEMAVDDQSLAAAAIST